LQDQPQGDHRIIDVTTVCRPVQPIRDVLPCINRAKSCQY
jgi:hypothetical protein